jgi:hypothetical protein
VSPQIPEDGQTTMIGCICPPNRMGASCSYRRVISLDCGAGLGKSPLSRQVWTCNAQITVNGWDETNKQETEVLYDCSITAEHLNVSDTALRHSLTGIIQRRAVSVTGVALFTGQKPPVALTHTGQCNAVWDALTDAGKMETFCRPPLVMARGMSGCVLPDSSVNYGLFANMYGPSSVFCRAWPTGVHTTPLSQSRYLYLCENVGAIGGIVPSQILGNLPDLLLLDCYLSLEKETLMSSNALNGQELVAAAIVDCCSEYGNGVRDGNEVIQCG